MGAVSSRVNGGMPPHLLLKMSQNSLLVGLFAIACQLQGCGTFVTNTLDPAVLLQEDECARDFCTSLPRIYSGTVIDICGVIFEGGQGSAIMFWDLPLSFVADTVILPYTAYKQIMEGNSLTKEICLAEKEKRKVAREEKRKQLILQGR